MPYIFIFVGSQLRYVLDRDMVGGINYTINPSRLSPTGMHHLSITERTGGRHYDFFIKTPEEGRAILNNIARAAVNQVDVLISLDAVSNSQDELARFPI